MFTFTVITIKITLASEKKDCDNKFAFCIYLLMYYKNFYYYKKHFLKKTRDNQ